MILTISTAEAIELIKSKTNQTIGLTTISENTITVTYQITVKIPIIGHVSKNINVDLTIEKVVGTDLYLQYSTGSIGIDAIINAVLPSIPSVSNYPVADINDNGAITLHLKQIKQLDDILENITIDSVSFGDNSILVSFTPKV